MDSPGFLILAAGKATRFGGNKLTAHLNGKPVIQHTLDTLKQLREPIAIVYNAQDHTLLQCIENYNIQKIPYNADNIGMGHSLSYGVKHTPNWKGWIVCLGDMPWITLETYQQVVNELQSHDITRPHISNMPPGHPVGFQHKFQQELLALTGDDGAKCIISRHKSALFCFDVQDCGILLDIDRPSDLNRSP